MASLMRMETPSLSPLKPFPFIIFKTVRITVSYLCWTMTALFFEFGCLKKGTLSFDPAFSTLGLLFLEF